MKNKLRVSFKKAKYLFLIEECQPILETKGMTLTKKKKKLNRNLGHTLIKKYSNKTYGN